MPMESCLSSLPLALGPLSRLASAIFTCAFPFEYSAHVARHLRKSAQPLRAVLLFPLRGGKRHTVFQVFAWALWALSAVISLHTWHSALLGDGGSCDGPPSSRRLLGLHLDAASGAAAVSGLWSQLFLIKALLVFDASAGRRKRSHLSSHHSRAGNTDSGDSSIATGQRSVASPTRVGDSSGGHQGSCSSDSHGGGALLREQSCSSEASQPPSSEQQQLLAPRTAAHVVCWLGGGAMSVTGCLLLHMLEHMPDTQSRVLYCCLALSCVFIGASSTHGLGGYLRHVAAGAARSAGAAMRRSGSSGSGGGGSGSGGSGSAGVCRPLAVASYEAESMEEEGDGTGSTGTSNGGGGGRGGWRFFQPFQGGSVFVATQAIGWSLFSATVVVVLLLAKQLVAGVVGYCLRCWALAGGALILATQLVLGLSILTYQYQQRGAARRLVLRPALRHPRAELERAAGLLMPVVLMYLPLHIVLAAVAATFVLLPPGRAAAAVAAVLAPYLALTLRGHPAHTGCRRWPWLCAWFSANVEPSLAWWAGRLEVVWDFDGTADQAADAAEEAAGAGELEEAEVLKKEAEEEHGGQRPAAGQQQQRRYMLGFHPHGLYPTGAGFVPLMPSVQAAFPGRTILTLTANIVHYAPGLRDIAGWAGFRQVTRATIRRALHDTGAALLCPGGQAELVFADRAFPRPAHARAPAPAPAPAPVSASPFAKASEQQQEQRQRSLLPQPLAAAAASPAAGPLLRLLGGLWWRRGAIAAAAAAPLPPCTVTWTTPSGSRTTLVSAYATEHKVSLVSAAPAERPGSAQAGIENGGDPGCDAAAGGAAAAVAAAGHVAGSQEGQRGGGGLGGGGLGGGGLGGGGLGGGGLGGGGLGGGGLGGGATGGVTAIVTSYASTGSLCEVAQAADGGVGVGVGGKVAGVRPQTEQPGQQQHQEAHHQEAHQQQPAPRAFPHPSSCSAPASPPHQLVIYAGHQGFVRLALEEGAWLVPVLAIGETLQLANLISAPELQRVSYKRLGFPVPFILAGRWGVTTLPLRNPLVYVLGKPLAPPRGWATERRRQLLAAAAAAAAASGLEQEQQKGGRAAGGEEAQQEDQAASAGAGGVCRRRGAGAGGGEGACGDQWPRAAAAATSAPAPPPSSVGKSSSGGVVVPQAIVDAYHVAFYASLADLWDRHRHRHPVLCSAELVFEWGRHGPPPGWK